MRHQSKNRGLARSFLRLGLVAIIVGAPFDRLAARADLVAATVSEQNLISGGLAWLGKNPPSEQETARFREILRDVARPDFEPMIERFFTDYPNSPWMAAVHHVYAGHCRGAGLTTRALQHWEDAWLLVKDDPTPKARELAGGILTEWVSLLSSLGRLNDLQQLMEAGKHVSFTTHQQSEKFIAAQDALNRMENYPELAYRCGTFALKAVGQKLTGSAPSLEFLVNEPSPTNGFTLHMLCELSKRSGLNMLAVHRAPGTELIVPSVIHWRQNHYAAVLDKMDDLYLVDDPTFGPAKWLSRRVIDEEASGAFLVPANQCTANWHKLSAEEQSLIHGMGLPNNATDGKDKGCVRDFFGNKTCPLCSGMPVWWVSEPYINLWIADEPLSYLTSRGERLAFRLTYKQRDTRPNNPGYPDHDRILPTGWNHTWFSYIRLVSNTQFNSAYKHCNATVYLPNGGEVTFPPGATL